MSGADFFADRRQRKAVRTIVQQNIHRALTEEVEEVKRPACPFCKAIAPYGPRAGDGTSWPECHHIECKACGARGPRASSEELAWRAFDINRRREILQFEPGPIEVPVPEFRSTRTGATGHRLADAPKPPDEAGLIELAEWGLDWFRRAQACFATDAAFELWLSQPVGSNGGRSTPKRFLEAGELARFAAEVMILESKTRTKKT